MNNKKQALDEAVKYFDKFATGASIRLCDNEYIVSHSECSEADRFPFVDVKDGDICIIRSNERDNISIYLCGRFRDGYSKNMSLSDQPLGYISNTSDIIKTGVNYFDLIK